MFLDVVSFGGGDLGLGDFDRDLSFTLALGALGAPGDLDRSSVPFLPGVHEGLPGDLDLPGDRPLLGDANSSLLALVVL